MMLTDDERVIWGKITQITDTEDDLTQDQVNQVRKLAEELPENIRAWVEEGLTQQDYEG